MLDPMWMQRGQDALRETLNVDDATKRDMIQFLLDEGFWNKDKLTTWDSAVARWNACMNPGKAEFFKTSELWALMKRFRRYQLLQAMAEDLAFDLKPKATEERRQELLERIAAAEEWRNAEVGAARAELARMDEPTNVRVHPAFQEGRGSFSRADSDATGF